MTWYWLESVEAPALLSPSLHNGVNLRMTAGIDCMKSSLRNAETIDYHVRKPYSKSQSTALRSIN